MILRTLVLLGVLCSLSHPTTSPSPWVAAARLLRQSTDCPVGCASCTYTDTPDGGTKAQCFGCQGMLVLNPAQGTCTCMPGTWADKENNCADCPKGSWCGGGVYAGAGTPAATSCGDRLTTLGKRSTGIRFCVNMPGTFYSQDGGVPRATTCEADKFGPGLRKQRACVPCPSGLTTQDQTGLTQISDCLVRPGYYLKTPGVALPCPRGQWNAGFSKATSCTRCAGGVTTPDAGSTSEADCTVVLAGFYPSVVSNGIVKAVQACPQKYICPGGPVSAVFDPNNPQPSDANAVVQCPDGTWTQTTGATSLAQCLTPPGHSTANGATLPCANGEYRSLWKRADLAMACFKCGVGLQSDATDEIVEYAITPDATPRSIPVRVDVESCYILPGQGLVYNPIRNSWTAQNCDNNNYGVSSIMYGLISMPCRDCPAGMITSLIFNNSLELFATDNGSPPHQGFTNPLACVTQAGYGYDGSSARPCPAGSYNAPGNYNQCAACPIGLSTLAKPSAQVSLDNCTIAKGYGYQNGRIQLCPIGTYNDVLRDDTTSPCKPCAAHTTTTVDGATSSRDCNLCVGGWGGSGCSQPCGGSNGATYAPPGQEKGSRCLACPSTGAFFYFDYKGIAQDFTPSVIARPEADSLASCLSQFAQVADMAWLLGGSAPLVAVPSATNLTGCVADCKVDPACMYVTYDYDVATGRCAKKVAGNGTDVIAFKATSAGSGPSGSSVRKLNETVGAKLSASGTYTYWIDDASGVGSSASVVPANSIAICTTACDSDLLCAAVVMTGITSETSVPTSCKLVYGDVQLNTWKRTLTRAVAERMSVPAALALAGLPASPG